MIVPANDHRRETPLLPLLREEIGRAGALPVSRYMEHCLRHPEHGYYCAQRAIGVEGDFITAPEISQIFGELIGLWCAVVWQSIGLPSELQLIEVGPGRGTLMSDALRALRKVPGLDNALSVHLIEVSPILRSAQEAKLSALPCRIRWHETLAAVPVDGPRIAIANEFLDTLPVEQYVQTDTGPRLRTVELDTEGQLVFATDPSSPVPLIMQRRLAGTAPGTVAEVPAHDFGFLDALALNKDHSGVALFIDYGHEVSGTGETLQAVRGHRFEHVLTSPGEADLSAQVDFSALREAANARGLEVEGPLPQAEFLGQLGILERASRLMAANPLQARDIEAGVLRLMAPNGMGTRFKTIAVKSHLLPDLPGFARLDHCDRHSSD
jgi:NADH dehydrogenase [ubiquinone] 1 alpha subcomplex assembly factor 7